MKGSAHGLIIAIERTWKYDNSDCRVVCCELEKASK